MFLGQSHEDSYSKREKRGKIAKYLKELFEIVAEGLSDLSHAVEKKSIFDDYKKAIFEEIEIKSGRSTDKGTLTASTTSNHDSALRITKEFEDTNSEFSNRGSAPKVAKKIEF